MSSVDPCELLQDVKELEFITKFTFNNKLKSEKKTLKKLIKHLENEEYEKVFTESGEI